MAAHEPELPRCSLVNTMHSTRFGQGLRSNRGWLSCLLISAVFGLRMSISGIVAAESPASKQNPRPSGHNEAGAPAEKQELRFQPVEVVASIPYDLVAQFPKDKTAAFDVKSVTVNGVAQSNYVVEATPAN